MKKRLLSIILTLALCLSLLPMSALAAETGGDECTHPNVNENGVCESCEKQLIAKIEVGGNTTYTDNLRTAMNNAADGTIITLLTNVNVRDNVYTIGKTVTLDLNGKNVGASVRSTLIEIDSANSAATLVITGSGSFTSDTRNLLVQNGTLDLSGWTDGSYIRSMVVLSGANSKLISPTGTEKIWTLAFTGDDTAQAADTARLTGGKYGEIVYGRSNGIKLGDLLAEGYAFRQEDGTFLKYATELKYEDTVGNVEVVTCPHPDVKDGKCLYCNQDVMARVGDTIYSSVDGAVSACLENGGMLTLYANASLNLLDFPTAAATGKPLTIDLNGYRINDNGGTSTNLNGINLTIQDSKGSDREGYFSSIVADSGSLTLESGCLQGLTIPDDSGATVILKGGRVQALACPKPVYTLLPDGYALMNGDVAVDPTLISNGGTETYTVTNAQLTETTTTKTGSATFNSGKIPFALSLKTDDSKVEKMSFQWYRIDSKSKAATLLAASTMM